MTNKEIADHFRELALLMELQDENPFKIRSYQNAYRTLRSQPNPVEEMSDEELSSLKGIGEAILSKINELRNAGTMSTLEKYREMTPAGIREMLDIKGIGPKKIRAVWKELGIESTGELLYACNENRLLHLRGFGEKTQEKIAQALRFYNYAKGRFLYADIERPAEQCLERLRSVETVLRAEWTGALRRRDIILEGMHFLVQMTDPIGMDEMDGLEIIERKEETIQGTFKGSFPLRIDQIEEKGTFDLHWFKTTGSEEFLTEIEFDSSNIESGESEIELMESTLGFFVPAEMRTVESPYRQCKNKSFKLLEEEDIRGVVHAHTTDSDGLHTLEQMIEEARKRGYEYLTVTDHSRSAFYAGGLSVGELRQQGEAIDRVNEQLDDFRVFKGIESDILYDGSLDYPDEVLELLDIVIISIHSQLSMDENKATSRLIRAIEHPETDLLGHPTGRLLLSRPGYPIDHEKILDACADNGVSIEINANPRRLDLDWTWIGRAREKEIMLSINPDAHSREGIGDIHFGVLAARKGGLTKEGCLNAKNAAAFVEYLGIKSNNKGT